MAAVAAEEVIWSPGWDGAASGAGTRGSPSNGGSVELGAAGAEGETASAEGETATAGGETATAGGETATAEGETATAEGETATAESETATAGIETAGDFTGTSAGETVGVERVGCAESVAAGGPAAASALSALELLLRPSRILMRPPSAPPSRVRSSEM